MTQEVVVFAVHGMGDTKANFANELEQRLRKELGDAWSSVYFDSIYYQSVLQPNQKAVMKRMIATGKLDYIKLRKFMLYGFSDAAGLERNASSPGSPYVKVQQIIMSGLDRAYSFIGSSKPVVIIAQSLGGHVISNYIWDAQQSGGANRGIWATPPAGANQGTKKDKFRRLKTLKYFYTTGCNIPIFLAGFPENQIKAVASSSKGYSFQWKNYFDEDDILGWPLKPLSASYRQQVKGDHEINVGSIFQSWNPLSHKGYWNDRDVIRPFVRDIRSLI